MQVTEMGTTKFTYTAAVEAALLTILLALIPVAISDDTATVPAVKSEINSWFMDSVKQGSSSLDPQLVAAEEDGPRIIKVRKDGEGDFTTVNDALKSIPSGNTKRVVLWIGAGVYKEKITVNRTKPFVTFYGDPSDMPTLVYDGTALQYGTVYSATLAVESDYFIAANIIISNSSPKPDGKRKGAQAVAIRQSGDKAVFYNCKFIGFQDTICDDKGKHLFKDCYIEGTVDFIFGSGKSLYLNTEIRVVEETGLAVITAQAGETEEEDTGYAFVHCSITGNNSIGAYLGRAWRSRPRVVFAYTTMGSVVSPLGWSDYSHPERDETVFFGEYQCTGAGASSTKRVKFGKQLSDSEAKKFISLDYIEGSKWLLPPPKL